MTVKVSFYNKAVKEAYLTSIQEDSQRETMMYLLGMASSIEELFERDIYTFSPKEIGAVIKNSHPLNEKIAGKTMEYYSTYIKWAIDNGHTDTNLHPLQELEESWSHQFAEEKQILITEKTLLEIEERLPNFQDKIVIRLPFEGVLGTDCSEICHLKEEDIDFQTGIAKVYDKKGGERETKLSARALELIKGALDEKEYLKWGLQTEEDHTAKLMDNHYVIRGFVKEGVQTEAKPQGYQTVYRRIKQVMEQADLPYITAKQLLRSGENANEKKIEETK